MIEQHPVLNRVAEPVDTGTIRTTLSRTAGSIDSANLKSSRIDRKRKR
jgi:NADPH2:quinone reductase